ncbi:response regulator [Cylindrospermum sp. FACHB-282]|uniref:response regulator n=1 Tax=Cylindrospermum sp. FACHB-282 TaxID=2692794 RepID=UPI0016854C0B|nr:response regulator [Cylindrospermum sp. FACHB-282]MBD2386856.1 response regulator [Cylindrospermum sp. FACHB-282]
MSTTSIGSYRLFQKLHPLSLLAQLTSRRTTGCLKIFTENVFWSIYLEEGKLIYASYSDKLFERLDSHLRRLEQQNPTLDNATRLQMRLMFETQNENELIPYPDYQAICWLVTQEYITDAQAAILIDDLAKEVLESFLSLKEGNYEFNPDKSLDELPKFCHLDLRLLVEYCQKQLRNRQNVQSSVPADGGSRVLPKTKPPLTQPQTKIQLGTVQGNNEISQPPVSNSLYKIACIDDSQTVLNSINHFLDGSKFSVVMINDPVKALMQILRSNPDLILLDVEMPSLDGYELCSLLRRHPAFKQTPIIMVTGRTGFIDKAKAKIVRSSGYLTKPFSQSDLLKMVFQHIG